MPFLSFFVPLGDFYSGMHPNHPDSSPLPPDDPEYPDQLSHLIAARLREERLKLGISAAELARRSGRYLSDQAILNNEAGTRNPGLITVARHCQALGLSFPALIRELHAATTAPR